MKETVIVTGANGYLGSYVVKELVKLGYDVLGLTFQSDRSTIYQNKSIQYLEVDITDFSRYEVVLKKLISKKKVSAVIHLAALLGSLSYDANYDVNALGTKSVVDFARTSNIERFIYVSTVCTVKKIKGPYGETKLIGEKFVRESKLDFTIFIPALILGPESLGLNRILKNMYRFPFVIPLVGNGKETQHPVYVQDFASSIVLSLKNKKMNNKTYQIAGDQCISFKDFVKIILSIHNRKKLFVPIPRIVTIFLASALNLLLKNPPFTPEHVKGLTQSSNLDTSSLKKDSSFNPTPLLKALKLSLNKVGNSYHKNLLPRKELIKSLK